MSNIIHIKKLSEIFQRNRDNLFLTDAGTGQDFTYGGIETLSLKAAQWLKGKGLSKGDKAALLLPNCQEYVLLYFACMHMGVIPVPINQRLHPEERGYIISDINPKILIQDDAFDDGLGGNPGCEVFSIVTERTKGQAASFLDLMEGQALSEAEPFNGINDDDTIIIIYTSGTTQRPKGIEISYERIIGNGLTFSGLMGLKPGLKFYSILDLAYLGGFYNLMLIPLLSEGSIVLDQTFNPRTAVNFWDNVAKYSINALWFVPSILSILLAVDRSNSGTNYCKNNIDVSLVGTAPLPQDLKRRFEEKYSLTLYENYGLSETFFISTNSPLLDKNKGVGKAVPGCKISIIDDNGIDLRIGEIGEVAVETDFLMKGYYQQKELFDEQFKNNRFCTGDIGFIDEEEYLFITDRKKDLIIRGGINISPKEIEEVIYAHPSIRDVAVVGVPHEFLGEEIVAVTCVGDNINEMEIKSYCRKRLSAFKIPDRVVFLDILPRSVTGKIQKNRLKSSLSEVSLKEK